MDSWEQIESIYQSALELEENQRAAFVEAACSGDEELRREVESLLAYDASAQGFMAKSALQVAAKKLATDHAPSLVGRQFGTYQIVSRIGAGGMGVVYRATDTRLNRPVAIKVLHSHLSARLVWRQRFEREARIISNLTHPNICALHDIGQEGDSDFLVMEYLEGQTLAQRLKKGPLPTEQVLRYAIEVAGALDQAHLNGVTHRDLKPGNIMLTRTGVKLLDFGLAKRQVLPPLTRGTTGGQAAGSQHLPPLSESITEEGMILGTLHYMAPEQVEGKESDARTDIFALGVVIYEMATGRKAFEGESKASLAAAILTSQPPPITTIQPLTPPVLERVVERCLAKDPEERWQSARDLAVELKWITEGQSAMAVPAAAGVQRGKRARFVAASGLALLLLFLAGWLIGRGYLNHSTSETGAIRFTVPLPDSKSFGLVAISPDGQKLALFNEGTLWIRSLKSDKAYSLAAIGNVAAEDRFWSPDSRFVAFWGMGANKATLKKVEVTGGAPKTICETAVPTSVFNEPGSSFGYGSWNREGVILFERAEQPKGISRVPAEGGTPVAVTTVDESREETDHVFPSFLPDGRHFLYGVRSKKAQHSGIYLGSLDSPESKRLQESSAPEKYAFLDMWCVYAQPGYLLYKRQGQLLARAFDAKGLRFTGDPLTLEDQPIPWSEPSVSENGTLCFADWTFSDINSQVTKFDRSGKKIDTIGSPGGYSDMDLSPDGTRLALEQVDRVYEGDIWLLDLHRAIKTRLTTGAPTERNYCPRWSADGNQVFFSSNRESPVRPGSSNGNLYSKPTSGEGGETALLKSKQPKSISDASRDRRYILYESDIETPRSECELWVLPLFGERKPVLFLQSAYQARFSPDGRWVAYTEPAPTTPENLAKMNVCVRSFPSGEGKWRVSTSGGRAPRWRGDGRELFYWTEDRKMMSAEVKAGADFHFGPPKVLFESVKVDPKSEDNNQRYAVSPDGQYFYMLVDQTPPTAVQIHVVLNWAADLPKK